MNEATRTGKKILGAIHLKSVQHIIFEHLQFPNACVFMGEHICKPCYSTGCCNESPLQLMDLLGDFVVVTSHSTIKNLEDLSYASDLSHPSEMKFE